MLAPFSGGQPKGGVEEGPTHLLNNGLQKQLEALGWKVAIDEPLAGKDIIKDEMDPKDVYGKIKRPALVSDCTEKVHHAVKNACINKTLPLTIGGDHSVAMGTVSGVLSQYPDACLLWIDAHADLNTPLTTESGNLHGCPVGFVMGLHRESWPPHFAWLDATTKLLPSKIAYIGLRDVDNDEKKLLRSLGIKAFSMYHVDKYGIAKVVEMALSAINPKGDLPIHLSYDVDALDPYGAPATGTPVEDGLTLREGLYIAEAVAETGNLVALDIVEVNPSLAKSEEEYNKTIRSGCAIARCALGETLL